MVGEALPKMVVHAHKKGDPLSPILFNVIVDMLAVLITRGKEDGQLEELIPHLIEGGVSIVQCADNTIF